MIYDSVLDAVGNTPLIKLNNINEPDAADIIVKFEALNVGGSIKTRTALQMIKAAESRGDIDPKTSTIVEPTSGNQGIGIALVCAVLGYKCTIIMPDSVSVERRKLVRHYGANVVTVHDAGDIGACINECIEIALRMEQEDENVYVPQQFENTDNIAAHELYTGKEIVEQMTVPVDGFCSGIGTGGTITGIGHVLKEAYPHVEIWAVEPETAAILSGGHIGTHMQMGIGDGLVPNILDQHVYDDICIVTDKEALDISRRLAREEGLLVGISAGTNVAAAIRLARKLGPGKTVLTLLPDTGERYFSTLLFEDE